MARTVQSRTTYYNAWDCSSCGTKGMNAHWCKQCPQCGSPKELDDIREAEYRTSTKVGTEYAFKGLDCMCDACGTDNKKRISCRNCGKALDTKFQKQVERFKASSDTQWRERKVLSETPGGRTASEEALSQPEPPRRSVQNSRQTVRSASSKEAGGSLAKKTTHRSRLLLFGLIGCVLLTGLVWLYMKSQEEQVVFVTAHEARWSWSLPLERFGPKKYSDTVSRNESFSYPSNSYQRKRSFSHSEDILANVMTADACSRPYTDSVDNGDGTTTVETGTETYDCPVSTKVGEEDFYLITYFVDEWQSTNPLTASGTGKYPVFPTFTPITGELRSSGRPKETFTIIFAYGPEQETFARTMPRSLWEQFEIGQQYQAIQNGFGKFVAVELIDNSSSFQ